MDNKTTFGKDPERLKRLLSVGLEEEDKRKKAATTASLEQIMEKPGGRIGHYKLLSVLGEGGMGVVYLADQKQPFRRQVALKVIKPGMDSKRVIARFEAERQALALLDHPNIAHVYDAGTTEAGRPYFVMEYVKGLSITEYCDHHKLTIEDRMYLFRQVCLAVHHAHQKGIIHRDIKPSNILVSTQDDQPVPKIIDFGVAKALAQPLTEQTLVTEQGQLFGTPEYMSPEQADIANEDIDMRSDIYSLGVLLYVLLTGVLPFDSDTLREGGVEHIRQVIRNTDPKTPSTRLSSLGKDAKKVAESRRIEVAALAKCLHRELEWIPLKAMRKEREERYRSASELADDVGNYLKGDPLIAGPPSTVYQLKKFIQKHRTQAIGTSVAGILLAVIAVISAMYIQAANRNKDAESLEHTNILSKAMEYRSKGQVEEALTEVESILNSQYVGPKARLLHARLVLELQGPAEAVKELEKLLNERDEIACQAHFLVARIYLENNPGDPETAAEYQRKAQEHQQRGENLFSETAEAYFNRSMMAGTVNTTLKLLNKAVDLDPGHYDSREARALAYHALRKYDEMEIDASVMIGNESSNSKGYGLRAIARREKAIARGEKELLADAIRDHNKAIKLSPAEPELYNQRRQTYTKMGNCEKVLSDAKECVHLQPNEKIYHFHSFCALVASGRYDEAKIKYDTIIDSGLMKKSEFNESVAKYVSDTLDDGLLWRPPESLPEGAAFLSMHESDEIYHQLAKKATRVVPEGFIPTWSPDGTEIAYTRGIHGYSGIEILNLESGKTRLLVVPGFDSVWSPDGCHIVFVRNRKVVLLAEVTTEYGAEIAPYEQREVWIIKADGTEEPRFLAKGHSTSWSSDSRRIYYHSPNDMKLYSVSIENGAKPISIVSCPGYYPTVSPNEKYVAYMWSGGLQIVELSTKLVVMSWTAPPIPWVGASQYWSRNGRELGIQGFDGLWIYNLDTKTVANVLRGDIAWCSWSRSDISQFAFHRQYGELHRAIWVAKLDPNVSTAEALGPGRTIEEYYQGMVDYYTRRIDTDPEDPARYLSRAKCYIYFQNHEKAIDDLEECAKQLRSRDYPSVLNQLAWFQATFPVAEFRNGKNAIKYATKSCELTDWKNFGYVDALAASYAEAGDFDSAVKWQKNAIDLLTEDTSAELWSDYESRLDLYQLGKPYRQSP